MKNRFFLATSTMHATFDGVHLLERFVKTIRITRDEVVIEADFPPTTESIVQMEIELLEKTLSSHGAGDVVEFDCEDSEGRELSGIATMIEVQQSKTGNDGVRFRIKMAPGVK